MLTTALFVAGATCAGALFTASRVFGFKRLVKHATAVDVSFTVLVCILMAGTLTGMATAILAGLMMACIMSFCKKANDMLDRAKGPVSEFNKGGWVYNQAPYV